jgi:hypothetical protein
MPLNVLALAHPTMADGIKVSSALMILSLLENSAGFIEP